MSAETPDWIGKFAKNRVFRTAFKAFVVIVVAIEAYLFFRSARAEYHVLFDSVYQNVLVLALLFVMLVGIYLTAQKNRK